MKKTIIGTVAAAILGAGLALTPTPASAFLPIYWVLESKKDPNFKAVNPYAKKAAKKSKKKAMKKSKSKKKG